MWQKNKLAQQLQIDYPIIQGPMSGANTPELVAAVSNAGGLGSFGAGQLLPAQIQEAIKTIRSLTTKPFAVNLFVPDHHPIPNEAAVNAINQVLDLFRQELNIPVAPALKVMPINFIEQIEVLITEQVPVFSFTFGILSADIIQRVKKNQMMIFGTATTVREASLLAAMGVDGVIAQGCEAGGHRGSAADTPIAGALVGTMALVPQMADQLNIPIIAAGGIMDGRGIAAALILGASAVQMGTAFLSCPESGINEAYRKALLTASDESTQVTPVFTGRYARGIYNAFMSHLASHHSALLAYPYQRYLTQDIITAAKQQNRTDLMMMWSGQAARLCRTQPAATFMAELIVEVTQIFSSVK